MNTISNYVLAGVPEIFCTYSYPLWYWCKGHVDPETFIAAMKVFAEDNSEDFECYGFDKREIQQVYFRNQPALPPYDNDNRKGDCYLHVADGPGRGAYPVTLFDCEA